MVKRVIGDVFLDGRVAIDPFPPSSGKKVTVMYKGLLAKSGADSVYLHAGYGYDNWSNIKTIPMTRQDQDTWVAEVPVEGETKLNFCFKDGADHWDNNNGINWGCAIV